MNVLHLIAPISFGGGESLLINLLSERQPGLNESVALIYSSEPFEAKLKQINIPYWKLRTKNIGYGIPKWKVILDTFVNLLTVQQLSRIVNENDIDLIHVQGYPACLLFYLLNKKIGIYTHQFYRKPAPWFEKLILTKVYSSFEFCTTCSNLVSQSMNQAFPGVKSNFQTIYNCVGNRFYLNPSPEKDYLSKFPKNKKIFVQIARFMKFKNQMLVVEALNKLSPQERDQIFVVFAGEGPERTNVMEFVKFHNLEDHVCFLGAVPYEKVPGLLAIADFGLFPSENEGFGIGAAECLAVGLPVLSLDTELMQEVIGSAGLQVPRSELHNGFKQIIEKFSNSSELAQERAETFRPSIIKKHYYDLYLNLFGRVNK